MERDASRGIGVYVHIPFCHHRCTYCDFNLYAGMRSLHERYARAVAGEIGRPPPYIPPISRGGQRGAAATIYFGGGTPSLMAVEHIELMLGAIRATFGLAPDAEITLEANPRTGDDGYFARLRALGVNRISLGMQSAIARDLHLFRRGHTVDDVARTVALIRAAGSGNLNLDLIYGIPGQSLDDWRVTLDAALALKPDHLSAYGLQVEDGTTLKKWIAQGKLPAPDDDLAADMFDLAEGMLGQAGFIHYEISNWARRQLSVTSNQLSVTGDQLSVTGDQLSVTTDHSPLITDHRPSRHNLVYWRNEPYLGFGCGAHSWFDGRRFARLRHPRAYIAALEAGQSAEIEVESIGRELEMGETMMVGLRLLDEGVPFERFAARFDADLREVYRPQIDRLLRLGLIEIDDRRIRLSRSGRLVGNRVFGEFLPTASSSARRAGTPP